MFSLYSSKIGSKTFTSNYQQICPLPNANKVMEIPKISRETSRTVTSNTDFTEKIPGCSSKSCYPLLEEILGIFIVNLTLSVEIFEAFD